MLSMRGEVEAFDDEFVAAACPASRQAIQDEIADSGDLPFYDRGVLANGCFAPENGARLEGSRAGIELHADVGRNHRAKDR